MRKSAALVLVVLGLVIGFLGHRQAESVSGLSDRAGTKIANAWDGGLRVPEHYWWYAGGGLLVVAGAALFLRRG
jgi:hypothetical protein